MFGLIQRVVKPQHFVTIQDFKELGGRGFCLAMAEDEPDGDNEGEEEGKNGGGGEGEAGTGDSEQVAVEADEFKQGTADRIGNEIKPG